MKKYILLGVSFVLLITLSSSFFIVEEGYNALLLQFGKIQNLESIQPGLHYKLPFIQDVVYVDTRISNIASDTTEVIAADQKRFIVNYYAKYVIDDVSKFFITSRSTQNVESKLKPIIESNMREQVGLVSLVELLNEKRSIVMDRLQKGANAFAKDLGIRIVDVRIKRTDLPEENSDSIFKRMQTDREKEAKEIRAHGFEESKKIRALAEKDSKIILSEAYKKVQIIKGEGDAMAAEIYNKILMGDQDFFKFYRTVLFYSELAESKNKKFVIDLENTDVMSTFVKGVKE